MPDVRLITMQKNETQLIDAWVKYHGYMFGFENLYILDNGSTESEILSKLELAKTIGVNVLTHYNTIEDFHNKGDIIANIIREWDDNGEHYDFVIVFDIDEFVFLFEDVPSFSRKKLHHYLSSLRGKEDAFIIDRHFLNNPGSNALYAAKRVPKSMFAAGTLAELDHGFHHPVSLSGKRFDTKLAYMHMHNKSFVAIKKYAQQKLKYYVDTSNIEAIREYGGPGHHLIKYWFMNEDEFKEIYKNDALYYIPDFCAILRALGVNIWDVFGCDNTYHFDDVMKTVSNFPDTQRKLMVVYPDRHKDRTLLSYFDGDFYIKQHSDVKESGEYALSHFAEFGWNEGRLPSDDQIAVPIDMTALTEVHTKPSAQVELEYLREDPLFFSKNPKHHEAQET